MRAGVIVAGGYSKRFGEEDKILADLAGVPMIRRVAVRLRRAVDELVVNCRTDQMGGVERALSGMNFEFAVDTTPDEGPLAGVKTGLDSTEAEYAAVVAADMPLVDPDFVSYLFERAAGHDAAVPRYDGRLQPIHAAYRTDAMAEACVAALSRGEHRLVSVLSLLDYVTVIPNDFPEDDFERTLTNLNTRAAFERVAAELAAGESRDVTDETK